MSTLYQKFDYVAQFEKQAIEYFNTDSYKDSINSAVAQAVQYGNRSTEVSLKHLPSSAVYTDAFENEIKRLREIYPAVSVRMVSYGNNQNTITLNITIMDDDAAETLMEKFFASAHYHHELGIRAKNSYNQSFIYRIDGIPPECANTFAVTEEIERLNTEYAGAMLLDNDKDTHVKHFRFKVYMTEEAIRAETGAEAKLHSQSRQRCNKLERRPASTRISNTVG